MITQKPAASRLPLKAASTAFAALLALGLPLAAQSRGHASGGGGGDRSAHSTGGGSRSSAPGGAPHYSGGNSGGNSGGGSSTGGGRTAHEVPGGSQPQRQPNGRGGGGHGHGGHYGGGYYGGGYYGGYYGYGYPYGYYGGWGFWPGFYGGYGYDYPYGYPYGYGYPGASGRYYDSNRQGALDLDVAPGRTHVFVDGQDLGPVDRYDGWPGYLWLPQGTYDVAFYLDGYKTIARQLTVYPGTVLDVDDRLEQGESIRPEDLPTKTHQRRDDRLGYERQRRERLDRGYGNDRGDDDQDWRDRAHRDRDRGAMRNEDRDDDDDQMDDRKGGSMSRSSGAHLRLSVEPEDASIYLDGQFVGTGSDVSLLQAGLPVAPGTHRLAVVRPGHRAVEKEFDVKAGGDIKLDIELESGSGR